MTMLLRIVLCQINIIDSECYVITALESCITSIKQWMDRNRLRMNSAKTDFIFISSTQQLVKCKTTSILASDGLSRGHQL